MPKRFTPEQFAASAAAGEPRSEQFFSGDSGAWHAYQESSTARCWARCSRRLGMDAVREEGAAAAR